MRLNAFRITNYRCVLDSDWIELKDLAVLVGKNEAGKTAILRALHKFNPFKPEPYKMDREWPRGHRQKRDPKAPVVTARFAFSAEERDQLRTVKFAHDYPESVTITRNYAGENAYKFEPHDLSELHLADAMLEHVIESSRGVPSAVQPIMQKAIDAINKGGTIEYPKQHAGLVQEVQAAIATLAKDAYDEQAVKRFLAGLDEFKKIAEGPSPKKQAISLVSKWIPTFVYMDDYRILRGNTQLDELKTRKDSNGQTDEDKTILLIMEMAGLDLEKEVQNLRAKDREQRMLDMNDASLTLTATIADRWSQKQYEVLFEADGSHLITFVKGVNDRVLVPLEERSKGFQWFFSFDMLLMYETKGTFKGAVLLLDEPGLHLHAAAQRDLLKRLKAYSQTNQMIYSTHLPFMIDMDRLDAIRICVENATEGTKVTNDLYTADADARFPLQAALGLSMSQSLFVGKYNLVVEGITDFWLLSTVSAILRDADKEALDERIVVTPAGGATKVGYVATMLSGQDLSVVVLLDSDAEGQAAASDLARQWIIKDRHVLLLGKAVDRQEETCLEDLLPIDFYLEYVNRAYKKEFGDSPLTAAEVTAFRVPQIVRKIDEVMKARGIPPNSEGWAFNKGRPAKKIMEELPTKKLCDLPAELVENFKKVFSTVNAAMPKLPDQVH